MKTITIKVSEPVYAEYRRAARAIGRPTSELIREAMEAYRRSHLAPREDLRLFQPSSLRRVLLLLAPDDDLLAELSDERRRSASTPVVASRMAHEAAGGGLGPEALPRRRCLR